MPVIVCIISLPKANFFRLILTKAEMLALTKADFDLEAKILSITKTYQVIKGVPTITSPKTPESKRKITIPDFLCEELNEFFEKIPHVKKNERIFAGISKSYLHRHIRQGAERAGVKQIRVHDLRHPYVKPKTKKFITFFEVFGQLHSCP